MMIEARPRFEPAAITGRRVPFFLASHADSIAAAFAAFHFLGLSAAVLLTQDTLSGDTVEQIAWSRDLQWVYAKHPPLTVWIMAAAMWASGHKPWAAAMLGPLASAAALFMVYRFASRIMDPVRSLIAMFLLEGVVYFNFASIEFNHNVILLPLWVLIASSAHRIYCRGTAWDWAFFGLAAALGMLGKYASLLLLAAVPLALAADRDSRRKLLGWGPPIAILCGSIALTPHIYHLYLIDFAPLDYANGRLQIAGSAFDQLRFPVSWFAVQILNAGPAILMAAAFLFVWRRNSRELPSLAPECRRDLRFNFVLFATPFLLCLAIQFLDGVRFHDMWGFPLFTLLGVVTALLTGVQPLPQQILPKFALASTGMLALAIAAICSVSLGSSYLIRKGARIDFPARELTTAVNAQWERLSGASPLRYVIAESRLGGIFAAYHKDHPSVLFNGDFKESFWLKPSAIAESGAILVWDNYRARHKLVSKFPGAIRQTPFELTYHSGSIVSPARVGWAVLPPLNRQSTLAPAKDVVSQRQPGPAVTLMASPLSPSEEGGYVDGWKFENGCFSIQGWAVWQPKLGATMLIQTNLPAERVTIKAVPRADVVAVMKDPRLADSGFELNICIDRSKPMPKVRRACLWTEDPAFGRQITHDWALCSPS
jgi:4-amino-4-deoxy-L-arabinose transferase-like glycosyltransferase